MVDRCGAPRLSVAQRSLHLDQSVAVVDRLEQRSSRRSSAWFSTSRFWAMVTSTCWMPVPGEIVVEVEDVL